MPSIVQPPSNGTLSKAQTPTHLRLQDGVELLDTIDKLRGLGIDKEIPLPQIVVVGQQSSGKSSVLEAISGIPFPTNDGLCTRFATEVVLRRASTKATKVQIMRHSAFESSGIDHERIARFQSEIQAMGMLDVDNIPDVVATAARCLTPDTGNNFSKDFLRVEVSGPTQDHLTLVDLPGLFHYTKAGQNSDEPNIVKNLAMKYMSEKRSIILAVLSAKSDYATQEILQMLKGVDPAGSRTMGIITGVDLVERKSARENDYLALAENETTPLALGWHVLRNPSFTERQNTVLDRGDLERRFFENQEPWSTIDSDCRGAGSLKRKLSRILMDHIGRELKDVVAALNLKIAECEQTLTKCGHERTTVRQKQAYLTKIGTSYGTLVKAALEGPYDDLFFRATDQRLRAKLRVQCDDFASSMESRGHKWEIRDSSSWFQELGDDKTKEIGGPADIAELRAQPCVIPASRYLSKVSKVVRENRKQEMQGTCDPLLIGILFKDQASRWRQLADDFCNEIISLLSIFVQRVVEHITESRRTRLLLGERLRSAMSTRETKLKSRLTEILSPYEKSCPTTHNPKLRKSFEAADKLLQEDKQLESCDLEPGCDRLACQNLIANMRAYYSVARFTFVDNVIALGVELCLLDGLQDLFSAVAVSEMPDEEIIKLASESPEDILHRRTTERRLSKLQAGRDVCQKYNVPTFETAISEVDSQLPPALACIPALRVSSSTPTGSAPSSTRGSESPTSIVSQQTNSRGSTTTTTPERNASSSSIPDSIFKSSVALQTPAPTRPIAAFGHTRTTSSGSFGNSTSAPAGGAIVQFSSPSHTVFGSGMSQVTPSKVTIPQTSSDSASGGSLFSFPAK